MAGINIKQDDFDVVACAAVDAWLDGEHEQARKLDKLARKINAALTNAAAPSRAIGMGSQSPRLTWNEVPSVLESVKAPGLLVG